MIHWASCLVKKKAELNCADSELRSSLSAKGERVRKGGERHGKTFKPCLTTNKAQSDSVKHSGSVTPGIDHSSFVSHSAPAHQSSHDASQSGRIAGGQTLLHC